MPFIKGMNIMKSANSPFLDRYGADMYRSKKNIYATSKSATVTTKPKTPVKSYSAVIDSDESGEGVSMEYVKSELITDVLENSEAKDATSGIKLDINSDNILNGIILSEILGKPLSKRKGR